MSEPIKVGDLVQIVRGCQPEYFGFTFRVRELVHRTIDECMFCSRPHIGIYAIAEERFGSKRELGKAPLETLKRIPPLDELNDVKRDEELTA